jgi:hypothetical protein
MVFGIYEHNLSRIISFNSFMRTQLFEQWDKINVFQSSSGKLRDRLSFIKNTEYKKRTHSPTPHLY